MLPLHLLRDWLKHDSLPREFYARALGSRGSTDRLCRAYAQSEDATYLGGIARRLGPTLETPMAASPGEAAPSLSRTLLVKAPGPEGERGVILSYFEYNWSRLLRGIPDYGEFARRYTVVHLPSWSPTRYDLLAEALRRGAPELPIYIQPANDRERSKLERFHPRIRTVAGLACDWVDPACFLPRSWAERDIDLLVVSNWAPFKRHWELFSTLRRMPRDLRVVCVGQPDSGKTLADIRELQRRFRAPQEIEFLESIPIDRVTDLQCRAKVSPLFSRWEGGCVAAVEALMAGSVLAMREDARIGARAHVNAETGVTFRHRSAAEQLLRALEDGQSLRPREWAIEHIAADRTLEKLNAQLRADSFAAGRPWTTDLAAMRYRPYLALMDESDRKRLDEPAQELTRRYPTVFAAGWMEAARS